MDMNTVTHTYETMDLNPKGRALCDFVFRDGPALGLLDEEALILGRLLIKQWDGSETLAQMFRRIQARLVGESDEWPEVVGLSG